MQRILAVTGLAVAALVTPAMADHLNIDIEGARASGATVTIPSVLIDEPGFIVLHAVEDGEMVVPASIGHTYIEAGTSTDVQITADYDLMAVADYYAMLHYDTDGDGVYSFGEGMTDVDTPALNAEDQPYVQGFSVASAM